MPRKPRPYGTRFRPSSADRYLACPSSVVMTQDWVPDDGSKYADTGTVAHMLGELCIEHGKKPEEYLGQEICSEEGIDIPVDEAMCEAVQVYLDWVNAEGFDKIMVEESAPLDFIPGSEASSGRIDLVGVIRDFNLLYVGDYKNGVIPVGADTYQIGTYSIAIREIAVAKGWVSQVDGIMGVVAQPNGSDMEPIKTFMWTNEMLDELKQRIIDTVNWVIKQKPEHITPDMFHGGSHCKFCPMKHKCPAQAEQLFDVIPVDKAHKLDVDLKLPAPSLVGDDMIAKVVKHKDQMISWINDVTKYAYTQLSNGVEMPGSKLVKGRRGRKTWSPQVKDTQITQALLSLGLEESKLFTKKLLTPTQAEKLLKKDKDKIDHLIKQGENSIDLVSEDDPRESISQSSLF